MPLNIHVFNTLQNMVNFTGLIAPNLIMTVDVTHHVEIFRKHRKRCLICCEFRLDSTLCSCTRGASISLISEALSVGKRAKIWGQRSFDVAGRLNLNLALGLCLALH